MTDIVIRAEGLTKKYRINAATASRYSTLRDAIANLPHLLRSRRRDETDYSSADPGFCALDKVSFEIRRGDVVGIIGRNGAGKSTLLKILSRITEPTRGRVTLDGHVASLLEVGTGFHPELTGRENIFLNGVILGMTRREVASKIDEIVAFAEVEKFLDMPVKRYSSGMYVRLAFAVAAHLDPEIMIVDEVLAVGDIQFQKRCLGKMQDVAKQGRTVLFVSHNLASVRTLCTRALLLKGGYLINDGEVANVIAHYVSENADSIIGRWVRGAVHLPDQNISFSSIDVNVKGSQPALRLEICMMLECLNAKEIEAMIALDLCDASGTPLMQALPVAEPFMKLSDGLYVLRLVIDLPPLIPGRYLVDAWVGSHYSTTLDYIKSKVGFDIDESPTPNRTFPHTVDHGFISPSSTCEYEKIPLQ